ncbi:type II toxin-antitoxin system VapC family toxin [Aquiflexum lacus]|uniref:type II toxin-antitoxin system VapC family toxin n=1 Tax=Aquiflexum lacus TaxID=2483805 RepID=UPI00189471B5|nr:PIN domain-containing protein [Aquiflexum lacus]
MVLIDTSLWITYLNDSDDTISKEMFDLIIDDQVCICPTIMQELLQGCRSENDFTNLAQRLDALQKLTTDPYLSAEGAAKLFFSLKKKGISIRKSNDCLIAWTAIHFNIPLWHMDRDFDNIARGSNLQLFN